MVGPTKTNPSFFNAFASATDSGEVVGTSAVVTGGSAGAGRNPSTNAWRPPFRRSATVARALVIAASTLSRLRTMPASAISRARSASSYAATDSASKPAKAARKFSRFSRIVRHDRPDWNASSVSRSRWAASPWIGTPHSVSW